MIQLNPLDRLGSTPESMVLLKRHPFFDGIDFEEVSSSSFKGAMMELEKLKKTREQIRHKDSVQNKITDMSMSQRLDMSSFLGIS